VPRPAGRSAWLRGLEKSRPVAAAVVPAVPRGAEAASEAATADFLEPLQLLLDRRLFLVQCSGRYAGLL